MGEVAHVQSVTSLTSSLQEGGTLSVAQQLEGYRAGEPEAGSSSALQAQLPPGSELPAAARRPSRRRAPAC